MLTPIFTHPYSFFLTLNAFLPQEYVFVALKKVDMKELEKNGVRTFG